MGFQRRMPGEGKRGEDDVDCDERDVQRSVGSGVENKG